MAKNNFLMIWLLFQSNCIC